VQWQNELAGVQAAAMDRPHGPPWHKPSVKVKRIQMMDFASTLALTKGVAPTASHEEGRTEAAAARPQKASPLPTAVGVDKMYCQLPEIHAITAAQLVECAH
jgi:hypothetical protein